MGLLPPAHFSTCVPIPPPFFRPLLTLGLSLFPSNILGPFPRTVLREDLPLLVIFPGLHCQLTFSWVWPLRSFGEKWEWTRNQGILHFLLCLGQQVWQPLFLLHGSMLLTGQSHHACSFFLRLQPWPLLIHILPLPFQPKVGRDFWLLLISELLHCPQFGSQFFCHCIAISLFSSPSVSNASVFSVSSDLNWFTNHHHFSGKLFPSEHKTLW